MATPNSTLEVTARGKIVLWLAALAGGAAWLGDDENARLAAAMLAAPLVVDFVAKQRRLHFTSIRLAPRIDLGSWSWQWRSGRGPRCSTVTLSR